MAEFGEQDPSDCRRCSFESFEKSWQDSFTSIRGLWIRAFRSQWRRDSHQRSFRRGSQEDHGRSLGGAAGHCLLRARGPLKALRAKSYKKSHAIPLLSRSATRENAGEPRSHALRGRKIVEQRDAESAHARSPGLPLGFVIYIYIYLFIYTYIHDIHIHICYIMFYIVYTYIHTYI